MPEIFGNYIEMEDTPEYLIISFSSSAMSIHDRWRTNSLSADFLADYWGTFFPAHGNSRKSGKVEVKDAVGYIANELLENAIKFSYEDANRPVKIGLFLCESELRFYVSNSIRPEKVGEFQDFIGKIMSLDTEELYLHQLESNAKDENATESGLGYLTILNDYDAELAWKFEQFEKCTTVTTMVRMEIVRTSH